MVKLAAPGSTTSRALKRHRILIQLASSVIFLAASSSALVSAKEVGMNNLTKLRSACSFGETVEKLRAALQSKGFTIFALIDQRAAAQSVDLDMPPTTLIVYGNPKGGTPLMLAAPDFAIELPLRVLVREDASGTVLVIYTPTGALDGRHGLPAGMASRLAGGEATIAAATCVADRK